MMIKHFPMIPEYFITDLKERIFESADLLFSELRLQRYAAGWRSGLKLDLSQPHTPRPDKSYLTKAAPYCFGEQGGEVVETINYYQRLHGLATRIEAIKAICDRLQIQLPTDERTARHLQQQQRALSFFDEARAALRADGRAFEQVRAARGYDSDTMRALDFGLLTAANKGNLLELIEPEQRDKYRGNIDRYAGRAIVLPYEAAVGTIGAVLRALDDTLQPKYCDVFFKAAETKKTHLFGLTRNRQANADLLIVEGEIDAMRARAAGVAGVAACTGLQNITLEQLDEAKQYGARRITLLLDNDKGKDHSKEIDKAAALIRQAGLTPYVAAFPDEAGFDKIDTDSYLLKHAGADLEQIRREALLAAIWKIVQITPEITDTNKEFEQITENYVQIYSDCSQIERIAIDRILIDNESGITPAYLKEQARQLREAEAKKQQQALVDTKLKEAQAANNTGDERAVFAALKDLQRKAENLAQQAKISEGLELPTNEQQQAEQSSQRGGIPTGYVFRLPDGTERELELRAAALTYICAPTGHGKSLLLQNLALRFAQGAAQTGSSDSFLYICLEASKADFITRLINISMQQPLREGADNFREIEKVCQLQYTTLSTDQQAKVERLKKRVFDLRSSGRLIVAFPEQPLEQLPKIEFLCAYIRAAVQRYQIKAVFVDYVQIIESANKGSKKEQLSDICDSLRDVSIETNLPFVVAAQLNREAISPLDMSAQNIADASNIEHSADTIVLCWNSAKKSKLPAGGTGNSYYYNKTKGDCKISYLTKEAETLRGKGFLLGRVENRGGADEYIPEPNKGRIYLTIAKSRNGDTGSEAILRLTDTGYIEPNEPEPQQGQFDFSQKDPFEN